MSYSDYLTSFCEPPSPQWLSDRFLWTTFTTVIIWLVSVNHLHHSDYLTSFCDSCEPPSPQWLSDRFLWTTFTTVVIWPVSVNHLHHSGYLTGFCEPPSPQWLSDQFLWTTFTTVIIWLVSVNHLHHLRDVTPIWKKCITWSLMEFRTMSGWSNLQAWSCTLLCGTGWVSYFRSLTHTFADISSWPVRLFDCLFRGILKIIWPIEHGTWEETQKGCAVLTNRSSD